MVSHELVRWATPFLIHAAELDWGYILQFWDPNQHFGERMTENLDQALHTDTAKTIRPAASPWVLLVFLHLVFWFYRSGLIWFCVSGFTLGTT